MSDVYYVKCRVMRDVVFDVTAASEGHAIEEASKLDGVIQVLDVVDAPEYEDETCDFCGEHWLECICDD